MGEFHRSITFTRWCRRTSFTFFPVFLLTGFFIVMPVLKNVTIVNYWCEWHVSFVKHVKILADGPNCFLMNANRWFFFSHLPSHTIAIFGKNLICGKFMNYWNVKKPLYRKTCFIIFSKIELKSLKSSLWMARAWKLNEIPQTNICYYRYLKNLILRIIFKPSARDSQKLMNGASGKWLSLINL